MKKLYAIADLHLSYKANREEWALLAPHPGDGLILAGDLGEQAEHLELAFSTAVANFERVFWCPGNHELYSLPGSGGGDQVVARGEAKYLECVEIARRYGVLTPEDEYVVWDGGEGEGDGEGGESGAEGGRPVIVAPIFTLYDYSWRPEGVAEEDAVKWAEAADTVATDEFVLHPDPYKTRQEWCAALVAKTEARLEEAVARHGGNIPLVIANHWPLRRDLVFIPKVPRFILWCGTTLTEEWHRRFKVKVVVSGHLHVRRTDWKDGVRFEEVSFGYPRQWREVVDRGRDVNDFLREILPGPGTPEGGSAETQWRRWL